MTSKITAAIASLVILIAGVYLWLMFWPHSGKFDPTPSVGVGQVLAEETAKAVVI